MPFEPITLIVTPDEIEGQLLKAMLATFPIQGSIVVASGIADAANLIASRAYLNRLGCAAIDTRIYDDTAASTLLSRAIKQRITKRAFLLLHYSANKQAAVTRSNVSGIEGLIEKALVDRSKRDWTRELAGIVRAYLDGLEFLENLSDLERPLDHRAFPVRPSITSELLTLKALARSFGEYPDDWRARFAARAMLRPQDTALRRFSESLPVALLQESPNQYDLRPQVLHGDGFEVHSWRRADSLDYEAYVALLCRAVEEELQRWRAEAGSIEDHKLSTFVIELWNNRKAKEHQEWANNPFVDSSDQPLTVVFPQFPDKDLLDEATLRAVVAHEMAHLFNRAEREHIPLPWVWFDEALANWCAYRRPPHSTRKLLIENLPLDSLDNKFGGLAFACFLEARFGPRSLRAIWRSKAASPFVAAGQVTTMDPHLLIVEFYQWAQTEGMLKRSPIDELPLVLPHASCLLRKTGSTEITVACRGKPWHQLYGVVFPESGAARPPVKLDPSGNSLLHCTPDSHLLLVNAGFRPKPHAFNDEGSHIEIHLLRRNLTAGAGSA